MEPSECKKLLASCSMYNSHNNLLTSLSISADYMKGQGIFNTNFADPSELVGSKYNSKWYFVSPDDYTFK